MKLPAVPHTEIIWVRDGVLKRNCAVAYPPSQCYGAIKSAFALVSFGAVHLAFHPCSPADSGTGYSGEGE